MYMLIQNYVAGMPVTLYNAILYVILDYHYFFYFEGPDMLDKFSDVAEFVLIFCHLIG